MRLLRSVRRWLGLPVSRKRLPRERFLLPKEWHQLRPILSQAPLKVRIYFSILLLEGCRMSELRHMQWKEIDLDAGLWHKAHTKNGRRQLLPLSDCACDLFKQLPQLGPYVFPGAFSDVPWSKTAVRYWWRKIRWAADCPDMRIHDLRRTTGSWLTMHGENLKIVQSVLDHSSLLTTQIYARLDIETVRAALNRHAARVMTEPPPTSHQFPERPSVYKH